MHLDKFSKLKDLAVTKEVVVELGCGQKKLFPDSIAVDSHDSPAIDIVADINLGLGFFKDNSIDRIHAYHFLEHIADLENVMREIFRVLKAGGEFIGSVPHFSNPYYYSDYTHKHFFGLYSLAYFSKSPYFKRRVPDYYNEIDFKIASIELFFLSNSRTGKFASNIFNKAFNRSLRRKEFYEKHLTGLIHCYEIRFQMKK